MTGRQVDRDDVVRLFGNISDQRIADILATGASLEEMEQAAAWLAQEDDVMGELERPLTGAAAEVYEIVASDPLLLDEERHD